MDKSFLKKCWENKRLHALIVFLIWIIVLAVAFGVIMVINTFSIPQENKTTEITENKKEEKQEEQTETELGYIDKLNKLVASNYEFVYLITENKDKTRFEGTKEDNIIKGFKQTEKEIIKYRIENQQVYQILIDKEVPINNLYDGIDASLLDLNYIIGILNQVSENNVIKTEEELITTYDYNLTQGEEELEIIVKENKESIESISIYRNNETYELMYNEKY